MADIVVDDREPERRYLPGHPDADAQGYVAFPRVNPAEDMVDLMGSAQNYAGQHSGDFRGQRHDPAVHRSVPVNHARSHFTHLQHPGGLQPAPAPASTAAGRLWRGPRKRRSIASKTSATRAPKPVEKFLSGEGEELHTTVLATQRAELAFQLFLQVRNKVVDAYQEIMRMQM